MKTVTYTTTETANLALDFLRDRSHAWIKTPSVVTGIGLRDTDSNRTRMREVLDRLKTAGHVDKKGDGHFMWKVTEDCRQWGWDRVNPFTDANPGYTPPEPKEDEPEQTKEEDDKVIDEIVHGGGDTKELKRDIERLKDITAKTNIRVGDIEFAHSELARELKQDLNQKEDRLDKLEKLAATASQGVKLLKIERYDGKIIKLKDVILPSYFQRVLDLAKMRRNILLVGPAGCGKTTMAELIAKTLGLPFGKVGGSAGLTELHLLGKSNHNLSKGTEKWKPTEFVTRYEKGGVMLIDELDAADQNVLLALNPALDRSGHLPLPNRPDMPATRHKDFVCIATANTFGRGATRQYAGRNQLDEATLDRFRIGIVECYYDEAVERCLCPDEELRVMLTKIRTGIERAGVRRVMSSRFMEDAYTMKVGVNWTNEQISDAFFQGWTADEKSKVLSA